MPYKTARAGGRWSPLHVLRLRWLHLLQQPDHAVDGAFELDELLGVGPHRSAELRGQTRDDLQLIRDRIQRAREIVMRHRSSFDFTTWRREPRAWVKASIKNAFTLTFRCFAVARTRRFNSTGSRPTICIQPLISCLQVWGRAVGPLTHDRSVGGTSRVG